MNLVDCYVLEVLDTKVVDYGFGPYTVFLVRYTSYGVEGVTDIMFKKGQEPEVKKGFVFLG
jgi:hypothetical protein